MLRELKVTAHLQHPQHPHILPIIGGGQRGKLLYNVMPYVGGESLREDGARGDVFGWSRNSVVDSGRLQPRP